MNLNKNKETKWYFSTPAIIIGLILFFPIGIYQTFKSDWSRKNKTIAISITLLMAIIGLGTEDTPSTVNNSSEVETTEEVVNQNPEEEVVVEDLVEEDYVDIPASLYYYVADYKDGRKYPNVSLKRKDNLLELKALDTYDKLYGTIQASIDLNALTANANRTQVQFGKTYITEECENNLDNTCLVEVDNLGKYTEISIYSTGDYFRDGRSPETIDDPSTDFDDRDHHYKKVNGEWIYNEFTLVVPTKDFDSSVSNSSNFEVTKVGDGDTITVLDKTTNETSKVRLACIDAPETSQPYGKEAEYALNKLLGDNPQITLNTIDTDRYDRLVSEVFVDGVNLNQSLVESGLAVIYPDYFNCDDKTGYINSQQIAKDNNKNIWADPNFIMPWDWRKGVRPEQEVTKSSTPTQTSNIGGYISGTCKSLKAKGLGPFYKGDANYTFKRDRDNDEIACE